MTMSDDHRFRNRNDAAPADDAWLESLLRDDAARAPHIDDAGFTARAMAQLPAATPRARYRWIVPAMGVLGFFVGLVVLSAGESLSLNLTRLISTDAPSLRALFAVALPLGILYWLGVGAALQQR
jgi:hypothetical protein